MSRRFSDEVIEEVKNANDIVSVISEYVALKKKGKNYWGCCPFHNEKTPSFSVSPEKGFYYCFGCHAHGNVFNFLMEHEHYSFLEAVEKLADRANVALPTIELSKDEQIRESQRQELYKINELAANFFHNCLTKTSLGKAGLMYLKQRGLSDETIKRFRLGFAPDSWDKLYKAFTARGIDTNLLIKLGLCREANDKVYDYFRNRVIFPICDGKGRVVAFGGRVLDDSKPKYLNSPETEIFNKRRLLFGFDKAYRSIREKKQAILVEGYMDVIGAHNKGVTNVVASLGTAYTKEHGNLLIRQAEEVILAYDMDGAGQKAAHRAIELLQNTDFSVRVLAMPDGKDPDEFVRNHGGEAFIKLVDKAIKPFDFLLNKSLLAHDISNLEGKQQVLADMFPFIANLKNTVQREDLLRALALPLYLDNRVIFQNFKTFLSKGEMKDGKNLSMSEEGHSLSTEKYSDEDMMMAMALTNETGCERVFQYIPLDYLGNPLHQNMLLKAHELIVENKKLSELLLAEQYTAEEKREYARLMVGENTTFDLSVLDRYIFSVGLQALQEQYKEHSMLADKLSRAGDSQFIVELKKCQELQVLIKEWSKYTT